MTHYGSGADVLAKILNDTPRICYNGYSGITYNHPSKLKLLEEKWMELSNVYYSTPLYYVDRINENHYFYCKELYEKCNFIYFIKKPKFCIKNILRFYKTEKSALNYYAFRLRRICEMIRKTPNFILIYYEDLIDPNNRKNCFSKTEKLFDLKEGSLSNHFLPNFGSELRHGKIIKHADDDDDFLPSKNTIEKGNIIYEKYSSFLSNFLT